MDQAIHVQSGRIAVGDRRFYAFASTIQAFFPRALFLTRAQKEAARTGVEPVHQP
jgi:hypothetical protein